MKPVWHEMVLDRLSWFLAPISVAFMIYGIAVALVKPGRVHETGEIAIAMGYSYLLLAYFPVLMARCSMMLRSRRNGGKVAEQLGILRDISVIALVLFILLFALFFPINRGTSFEKRIFLGLTFLIFPVLIQYSYMLIAPIPSMAEWLRLRSGRGMPM